MHKRPNYWYRAIGFACRELFSFTKSQIAVGLAVTLLGYLWIALSNNPSSVSEFLHRVEDAGIQQNFFAVLIPIVVYLLVYFSWKLVLVAPKKLYDRQRAKLDRTRLRLRKLRNGQTINYFDMPGRKVLELLKEKLSLSAPQCNRFATDKARAGSLDVQAIKFTPLVGMSSYYDSVSTTTIQEFDLELDCGDEYNERQASRIAWGIDAYDIDGRMTPVFCSDLSKQVWYRSLRFKSKQVDALIDEQLCLRGI